MTFISANDLIPFYLSTLLRFHALLASDSIPPYLEFGGVPQNQDGGFGFRLCFCLGWLGGRRRNNHNFLGLGVDEKLYLGNQAFYSRTYRPFPQIPARPRPNGTQIAGVVGRHTAVLEEEGWTQHLDFGVHCFCACRT